MARMMPAIELVGRNSQIRKSQIGPRPQDLALRPSTSCLPELQPDPKHEITSEFREVEGDHVWLESCQQSNLLVEIRKFESLKLALDLRHSTSCLPDFQPAPKQETASEFSEVEGDHVWLK
jgi:hypothetical protein